MSIILHFLLYTYMYKLIEIIYEKNDKDQCLSFMSVQMYLKNGKPCKRLTCTNSNQQVLNQRTCLA